MSKKSAAIEAKFDIAVKTLLKAPKLTVPEAMLVAIFLTIDIENKSIQQIISRRIPGGKRAMATLVPPIVDITTCGSALGLLAYLQVWCTPRWIKKYCG
jgi:hypothetical protein